MIIRVLDHLAVLIGDNSDAPLAVDLDVGGRVAIFSRAGLLRRGLLAHVEGEAAQLVAALVEDILAVGRRLVDACILEAGACLVLRGRLRHRGQLNLLNASIHRGAEGLSSQLLDR